MTSPSYPVALDALANPGPTTETDDTGFELDIVVSRLQNIAMALEQKLGIGSSTPPATAAVLRRTATGASAWGAVATGDLATGAVSQSGIALASSPANNNTGAAVAIPGTSVALTTTGGAVLVTATFVGLTMSPAGFVSASVAMDAGTLATAVYDDATTSRGTRGLTTVHTPAAGAHTWDVRWGPSAGPTMAAIEVRLVVVELKK